MINTAELIAFFEQQCPAKKDIETEKIEREKKDGEQMEMIKELTKNIGAMKESIDKGIIKMLKGIIWGLSSLIVMMLGFYFMTYILPKLMSP
jgi:transcription termination factor NusB